MVERGTAETGAGDWGPSSAGRQQRSGGRRPRRGRAGATRDDDLLGELSMSGEDAIQRLLARELGEELAEAFARARQAQERWARRRHPGEGLRERKKRHTRQQISDVATTLFVVRGFDHVKVAEIAEIVGVSEKTVYNYFPTKESLVFDRADEGIARLAVALRERDASESPTKAVLRALGEDLDELDELPEEVHMFMPVFAEMVASTPALRAAWLDLQGRLVDRRHRGARRPRRRRPARSRAADRRARDRRSARSRLRVARPPDRGRPARRRAARRGARRPRARRQAARHGTVVVQPARPGRSHARAAARGRERRRGCPRAGRRRARAGPRGVAGAARERARRARHGERDEAKRKRAEVKRERDPRSSRPSSRPPRKRPSRPRRRLPGRAPPPCGARRSAPPRRSGRRPGRTPASASSRCARRMRSPSAPHT